MSREELKIQADDGINITVNKWQEESGRKTKGIVLILHGMAEHSLRYDEFAKHLNNNGFIVYACDHRGHGRTGKDAEKLGHFEEKGWQRVVDDINIIVKRIKEENEGLPLVLFGHSMGSILARTCIYQFGNDFNGVILSGTTVGSNVIKRKMGLILAKIYAKVFGYDKEAKLLDKISFGSYNNKFKPNKTNFDWLSRDEQKVNDYVNDELCGFICSAGFFINLLTGINLTIDNTNIDKIPKELPIFIFAGDKDPVGGYTKDLKKVYRSYKSSGIKNITLKFYKEGRHEMLNEINKEEVYKDIINWLDENIRTKNQP